MLDDTDLFPLRKGVMGCSDYDVRCEIRDVGYWISELGIRNSELIEERRDRN